MLHQMRPHGRMGYDNGASAAGAVCEDASSLLSDPEVAHMGLDFTLMTYAAFTQNLHEALEKIVGTDTVSYDVETHDTITVTFKVKIPWRSWG